MQHPKRFHQTSTVNRRVLAKSNVPVSSHSADNSKTKIFMYDKYILVFGTKPQVHPEKAHLVKIKV
jgi:hypothetical protein